jgi:hypothetical protein
MLQEFLSAEASAQQSPKARTQQTQPTFNQHVFDFWSKSVRQPYADFTAGIGVRSGAPPAPEDAAFVYFSESDGFQLASKLKRDKLADKGNMDVLVRVQRFRPSTDDRNQLTNLQTGSLRIDVKQVDKLPGVPEALAWTAMATLLSNRKGMPAFEKLNFNPGTAWGQFDKIPLPSGMGFWSWNFFAKKNEVPGGVFWFFFIKRSSIFLFSVCLRLQSRL